MKIFIHSINKVIFRPIIIPDPIIQCEPWSSPEAFYIPVYLLPFTQNLWIIFHSILPSQSWSSSSYQSFSFTINDLLVRWFPFILISHHMTFHLNLLVLINLTTVYLVLYVIYVSLDYIFVSIIHSPAQPRNWA